MQKLENLMKRILLRVNISLREFSTDVKPFLHDIVQPEQLLKFYAFYGVWSNHSIHFHFSNSNLAGTYFLGRCAVDNSILYKCDIRGDELKEKGDTFPVGDVALEVEDDEKIHIKHSFLIKTLVHSFSHNPEKLELFLIKNTASTPYANIHGSPVEGCFLEPFSTVDLSSLHDCRVGTYTYLQVGTLSHQEVESGRVWVKSGDVFDFNYSFPEGVIDKYIALVPGKGAVGMFMDFAESRKKDSEKVYEKVHLDPQLKDIPPGASVNRYSVLIGKNSIGRNVLVAQRAFLESSSLGEGANAQENCFISNSTLEGFNVTAHGASIIHSRLGKNVFVGFNSFLMGSENRKLTVGAGSIVMPHTIIDLVEPVDIPEKHIVWGYIRKQDDLKDHCIPIEKLMKVTDGIKMGNMTFQGNGEAFVEAFKHRINHILEANGAFFDGEKGRGHAQKSEDISFNIIQPYPRGEMEGLYPSIDIET